MKEGIHLKSRAAVAFKAGEPLKIVEIDVEDPKAGEVLSKNTVHFSLSYRCLYIIR